MSRGLFGHHFQFVIHYDVSFPNTLLGNSRLVRIGSRASFSIIVYLFVLMVPACLTFLMTGAGRRFFCYLVGDRGQSIGIQSESRRCTYPYYAFIFNALLYFRDIVEIEGPL